MLDNTHIVVVKLLIYRQLLRLSRVFSIGALRTIRTILLTRMSFTFRVKVYSNLVMCNPVWLQPLILKVERRRRHVLSSTTRCFLTFLDDIFFTQGCWVVAAALALLLEFSHRNSPCSPRAAAKSVV